MTITARFQNKIYLYFTHKDENAQKRKIDFQNELAIYTIKEEGF